MLLDIIIMPKKGEKIKTNDLMIIEGILEGNKEKINYEKLTSDNNILRIRRNSKTKMGTNTKKEAEIFDDIKNSIIKGKHRSDYKINICYDGAAEYYCSKLMIPLAVFERKLRQFLYLIFISSYGREWVNKVIPKEKAGEFRKNNYKYSNKFVEMALECFTFQNYIDYIFEPRNHKSIEEIIEEVNKENENEEVTKEDIVKLINNNAEKALWELIFNDIKIEFSKKDIDTIREIRNEVVHNKEITSQKYKEYKKIINELNEKIRIAIIKIEEEKYRKNIDKNIDILIGSMLDILCNVSKRKIELEPITKIITYISNNAKYLNQKMAFNINEFKPYSTVIQSQFEKIENTMNSINSMNQLVNTMNQLVNQMNRRLNIINQLYIQKNFNVIGKNEESKENKIDGENDNN